MALSTHPGGAEVRRPILGTFLVLYLLTISAQFISLAFGRIDEARAFASIVLPSFVFLSLLTIPAIALGIGLGRQIGLGAPLIDDLLAGAPGSHNKLLKDFYLAGAMGVTLGGLLILIRIYSGPYLPPDLPAFGHRGLVGGMAVSLGAAVAEEVWFRLGLMTLLVWVLARIAGDSRATPLIAWPIIVVTAVGFGAAHLPQLLSYGAGSPIAIAGTIAGNTAVGILYGWCYWRRSLVAAMVAHFSVDVVLHVLPAIVN